MTTSFRNIFRYGDVKRIEIPIIQRDYAQGRQTGGVPRIRKAFLKVLYESLTGGEAVGLDFVYGEVKNGRMIPLDGQQRLTTLFLLHWYLAARNNVPLADSNFLRNFSYETRYSTRDFCKNLVAKPPQFPLETSLSEWIRDRHWYAGAWKHDQSIQSMLVMLDDIHEKFNSADDATCESAWQQLVAEDSPAITFESLSLEDMGLTDELYIKMNSRGIPLTPFEHFKADFEQTLRKVSDTNSTQICGKESPYQEFIRKVDQDWSDLLWPLRGGDIIDAEFLRLFHFLTDIVIYRNRLPITRGSFDVDIDSWSDNVYGTASGISPQTAQRYLFDAFDSLFAVFGPLKNAAAITNWFRKIFTEKSYGPGTVAIFDKQVDLLSECCKKYGLISGKNRLFSLPRTLLFFAVIEYLMSKEKPADFTQNLRTVRNLIFASSDEIRVDNFPALLDETSDLIHSGHLTNVLTYNKRQIEEEKLKATFLTRHPDHPNIKETLHRLEDHDLLRGCLAVFDFDDAATFTKRAQSFRDIFPEDREPELLAIGAALLACGDYSRKASEGHYQFGSPSTELMSVWRELLTNSSSKEFARTRRVFLKMLDRFALATGETVLERLSAITNEYLIKQEEASQFDWRYYLVKYDCMRSGKSGLYVSSTGPMGFDLIMMEKWQFWNSYYRDPYLLAVIQNCGAKEDRDVAKLRHYGTEGYKPNGRWIEHARFGELMCCCDEGFKLQSPQASELTDLQAIINKHRVGNEFLLMIPQVTVDDLTYDQEDRILAGSRLLKALISGQAPDSLNSAET